jgi:hypothetical protein
VCRAKDPEQCRTTLCHPATLFLPFTHSLS